MRLVLQDTLLLGSFHHFISVYFKLPIGMEIRKVTACFQPYQIESSYSQNVVLQATEMYFQEVSPDMNTSFYVFRVRS